MTLNLITGLMNSGKTEVISVLCFFDYLKGKTIYSNIKLNFPYFFINQQYALKLAKEQPDLTNTSFLFDELWAWIMDSRCSNTEKSRLMSYFFLQSSKDDGEIYISSQRISQNDKRIKENIHKLFLCERILKIEEKTYKYNSDKRILPYYLQQFLYIRAKIYLNNIAGDLEYKGFLDIPSKPFFTIYNTKEKIKSE